MENKIYVNKDGDVKMQKIVISFTGKGGEKGKQSLIHLVQLIENLKDKSTPEEVETLYEQITGYCLCCLDNEFIEKAAADELMEVVALITALEKDRARMEQMTK